MAPMGWIKSSPDEPASPRDKSTLTEAMEAMGALPENLDPLESRVADTDIQATVTDFLDFTEYLPSDTIRSMTLIGSLDRKHQDAAGAVSSLTKKWSKLPEMPVDERPNPVALRADISKSLAHAVSSRVYSHAEALRIQGNVNRHYNRAKYILIKLEHMRDNYPEEDEQEKGNMAPAKTPNVVRAKAAKVASKEEKMRRQRVPRITVPGDVIAPFEINCGLSDGEGSESSDDDSIEASLSPAPPPKRNYDRTTLGAQPKIKFLKIPKPRVSKTPKQPRARKAPHAGPIITLSQIKPPPENAVIGSPDAPWLQLTLYELAKLRKRMKKNASWTPSETMVARELKGLGRGPEDFKTAKRKAEEEGKPFDPPVPSPVVDPVTGKFSMPAGAMSIDSISANEIPTSNRGMKLNEAKKLKRDMAKQAAQEAEESAKRFEEIARRIMSQSQGFQQGDSTTSSRKNSRSSKKRKRDSMSETGTDKPGVEGGDAATSTSGASKPPPAKRAKTETPVPPPVLTPSGSNTQQQQEKQPTPVPTPLPPNDKPAPSLSRVGSTAVVHSQTPVPVPQVPLNNVPVRKSNSTSSPSPEFCGRATSASPLTVAPVLVTVAPSASVSAPASAPLSLISGKPSPDPAGDRPSLEHSATDDDRPPVKALASIVMVPLKPHHETPVPVPIHSPNRAATPIPPPAPEPSQRLEQKKAAETKKALISPPSLSLPTAQPQKCLGPTLAGRAEAPKSATSAPEPERPKSSAGTGQQQTRHPSSCSAKARSQEPPPSASLAADRPRRASTARNTPAPDGACAESFPASSAAAAVTGLGADGSFSSGSTSRPATSSGQEEQEACPRGHQHDFERF